MKDRIRALEKTARRLEPGASGRTRLFRRVAAYAERFLQAIDELPAYRTTRHKGRGIRRFRIGRPREIGKVLDALRRNVDEPGLNPASGGHLGYIPGGGIYAASLGDYLADVTNRFAGVFFASPGAVRMENLLLEWMAELVGYPARSGGNLTSGGSLANLIALVTARDARGVRSRDIPRSAIYVTAQAHHCIDKAIRIAGLSEAACREVPMDSRYRMIPEALERMCREDRRRGLRPWLVIATAGSTDVGAVDPLPEIARAAKRHGLWFHVDAAYGGFFLLTRWGRRRLRGIELSDSVVMDPHKGLFLPYGLGVVLIRDRKAMNRSHYYQANYMQDALASTEEPSPADLSPELTKHFRGLRLWLPLMIHGVEPFRAALEEKLLLARYFRREIRKRGFETGPEPELSVVTYRFLPRRGDPDEFNRRLLEEVVRDGRVFIFSTLLQGRFTLRLAVLAFRTHRRTVDLLLRVLEESVQRLEARS